MQQQIVNHIVLWVVLSVVLVSGFFPTVPKTIF